MLNDTYINSGKNTIEKLNSDSISPLYSIAYIDQSFEYLKSFQKSFAKDYDVSIYDNLEDCEEIIENRDLHLVIINLNIDDDINDFIEYLEDKDDRIQVILFVNSEDNKALAGLAKLRTYFRIIFMPEQIDTLRDVIEEAIRSYQEKEAVIKREEEYIKQIQGLRNDHLTILSIIHELGKYRNPIIYEHSKRVARLAKIIANEYRLPSDSLEKLHIAALYHDYILSSIIKTESDYLNFVQGDSKSFETHSLKMHHVFKNTNQYFLVAEIIKYHHIEQFPESMYSKIPFEAKILCLADKIDTYFMELNSYKAAINKVSYVGRSYFNKELLDSAKKAIEKIETKVRAKQKVLIGELKENMILAENLIINDKDVLFKEMHKLEKADMEKLQLLSQYCKLPQNIQIYDI